MTPIELAQKLQEQARALLFDRGVDATLRQYGEVIYTGSYALELMAWPDIDIQLALHPGLSDIQAAAELSAKLALRPDVWQVKLGKNMHLRMPQMPNGIYIGAKFAEGEPAQTIKMDVWFLSEADRQANRVLMDQIRGALTPETKTIILDMKQHLITEAGRTPSLSGFHLYQAVLFKGLTGEEEIRDYLRVNGVKGI